MAKDWVFTPKNCLNTPLKLNFPSTEPRIGLLFSVGYCNVTFIITFIPSVVKHPIVKT